MSFRLDNNPFSAPAQTPGFAASVNGASENKAATDTLNEIFTVSAKKNPPDAKEITDLVMKQIGYTEQDRAAYQKKYGEDARNDVFKQINDCLNTPGCVENPPAKPGETNAPVNRYPVNVAVSKLTTHRLREALDGIRQDTRQAVAGKTAVEQVRMIENAKRRELNGKLDNQPPKPGQSNTAATLGLVGVVGTLAGAKVLPELGALELPKVDPKAIAQSAAALGEMAVPAAIIAIEAVGPAAMLCDLHGKLAEGKAVETLARARDAARTADFSPLEMTAAPNLPNGTPPLEFPPVPPAVPPLLDQTGKVKTITQTTTPAAPPQIATQLPGRSSQPLPPPPPLTTPIAEQKAEDFIFYSKQAAILAGNMQAAGLGVKPAGFAAHHIVPFNDGRHPQYDDARAIMTKYGIDLNAATNGVYLPHKNDVYVGGMYHPKIHTRGYALELKDRLEDAEALGTTFAEKKQFVEDALRLIREDLMKHTMPIDRTQ